MVSCHLCLVGHHHGPTIALQSHTVTGLEGLFHESWVADQIHCGLAIQKYNLLEVKLDLGAMHLLEELCNSWFKLVLYLRELESIILELEVRIFFLCVRIGHVGVILLHLLELRESFLHALDILCELLDASRLLA